MKKTYIRLMTILLIVIFSCFSYMLLMGPVIPDLLSVVRMGDIVYYNKTFALIGGLPLICYALLCTIVTLFTKDVQWPTLPPRLEIGVLLTIFVPFIIGIIANFLVPFFFLASSYTSCPQENLSGIYVTDLKLCENLKPRGLW